MVIFTVLLEGVEGSHGYFLNVEVACETPSQAGSLARTAAEQNGAMIISIEEINKTSKEAAVTSPQVVFMSGRSYFQLGH